MSRFDRAVCIVALLCGCSSAGAIDFTPAEKAQVREVSKLILGSCKQRVDAELKKQQVPDKDQQLFGLITNLVNSGNYCSCVSKAFEREVTPELLRSGSQQAGALFVKRAGVACILPQFKAGFPAFCKGMMDAVSRPTDRGPIPPERVEKYCGCAQADVNAITVDTYDAYVHNTLVQYTQYAKTRQLPASDVLSLLSSMRRCGFEELKAPQ